MICLKIIFRRTNQLIKTMGTYSGEVCLSAVFLAFDTTSVSFICSEANVKHLFENLSKKSTKMVDQKLVCVTVMLLIVGNRVYSLPQPSSSIADPPALIAPSNFSKLLPRLKNVITVPDNCPEGQQMAIDGVCREVFD